MDRVVKKPSTYNLVNEYRQTEWALVLKEIPPKLVQCRMDYGSPPYSQAFRHKCLPCPICSRAPNFVYHPCVRQEVNSSLRPVLPVIPNDLIEKFSCYYHHQRHLPNEKKGLAALHDDHMLQIFTVRDIWDHLLHNDSVNATSFLHWIPEEVLSNIFQMIWISPFSLEFYHERQEKFKRYKNHGGARRDSHSDSDYSACTLL
jgi:hypothetical protein